MNILFLSQVLPFPLDAGPKVRSYYVLRALAEKHRVTLATFTRAVDSPDALKHLESFCHAVHPVRLTRTFPQEARALSVSLIQNRPFLIVRDDLPQMDAALKQIVHDEQFDAVHADQLSMAHYALRLPIPYRVLDQHNAVWTIMERLAQNENSWLKRLAVAREARLLKNYEAVTCAQFDRVVTVTAEDRAALTFPNHPSRAPIQVIPICVDPTSMKPLQFDASAQDLICVGGMFYPPNVDGMLWFAREVLPLVWNTCPTTRFYIVGARPDARLLELGRQDNRIIVTGYVPDADEYLRRAAAFVVPLRAGGGMRVKILDAWGRGLAIVSTLVGAEGISRIDGDNILIADTPDEFARQCLRLIQDRPFAAHLATQGRHWVESQYNWRSVYRAWDAVYPLQDSDNLQTSPSTV